MEKKYLNINASEKEFLNSYWAEYKKLIIDKRNDEDIILVKNQIQNTSKKGGKLFLFGNGASASLSSHAATDFTKQSKIKACSFNDHNLITAFSNDYGYENWVAKAIEFYANPNDMIFLISVSGNSKNLVKALDYSKSIGLKTVSLTGSSEDNYLKINSDLSLWVDSHAYNIVESIHTIWITLIIDFIIGKSTYSVS